MANLSKIRIAAIGLGWVSQHRHLPSIRRNPAFELAGVIDRHPGHAAAVAKRFGLKHHAATADLGQVPWLNEIDALVIGSAPMSHAALANQALAMGKHVLTEKPFCMNCAEGESMVNAARHAGRILAIVHNFQFSKAARKLERDIAAGRFGTIRRIAAVQLGNPRRRLPVWYPGLPLGLFYDESPHFFYLLRKFAGGEMRLVSGHSLKASASAQDTGSTPAAVSLSYRAAGGLPVTIDCNFESPVSEWYLTVHGEKALGIVDIFRDIYIHLPNDHQHSPLQIIRSSALATLQHWVQHVPNGVQYLTGRLDYGNDEVFARFARAIHTATPPQGISDEDALSVLRMQHEAIAAANAAAY
ncbi:MAG: Gfo/Idh/MocA family protein [Reyranellaceae bacterium]